MRSRPAEKTVGKTPWLVYGCGDGRSVVVVAAPGSAAMPFYFIRIVPRNLVLQGEECKGPAAKQPMPCY
jgi:hypothetical protein